MRKKIIIIFLIVIALVSLAIYWFILKEKENSSLSFRAQVTYLCDEGKQIKATFYEGKARSVEPGAKPIPSGSVEIVLSDGRNFTLPQTISASGIRYANENETFIFWSKGDTAFVDEQGELTFQNCLSIESASN